jgi:hypothetical protein
MVSSLMPFCRLTHCQPEAHKKRTWSQGMESNHRYTVLQTAALTTWLPWAASDRESAAGGKDTGAQQPQRRVTGNISRDPGSFR